MLTVIRLSIVYRKFREENYPTDQVERAKFLKSLNIATWPDEVVMSFRPPLSSNPQERITMSDTSLAGMKRQVFQDSDAGFTQASREDRAKIEKESDSAYQNSFDVQTQITALEGREHLSTKPTIHKQATVERANPADLEDSEPEELFIYDSNPHDAADLPRRFHSRTPTAMPMTNKTKGMSYNPQTFRWEGNDIDLEHFDAPTSSPSSQWTFNSDPMSRDNDPVLDASESHDESTAQEDLVSFFQKPYHRDAAFGKHQGSGGSILAWGYPIPEVPPRDFSLPDEFWEEGRRSEVPQNSGEEVEVVLALAKMAIRYTPEELKHLRESPSVVKPPGLLPAEQWLETSVSTIPEDISSVASVEDDIFSTTESSSSNSTVSSVRFNVIELIVGKFIEEPELFSLYEAAVNRMGNAKFVRNQRRLLKKFFLDLRSQTENRLQEEAIRILRGRAERTSMAEQIWRLVNPANPTRSADMAALKDQKPDKRFQLERMLGPQYVYPGLFFGALWSARSSMIFSDFYNRGFM